jgi:hypothetical protein
MKAATDVGSSAAITSQGNVATGYNVDGLRYVTSASYMFIVLALINEGKGKVKFRGGVLQHYSLNSLLYSDPKGVPSFISRGAAHQAA